MLTKQVTYFVRARSPGGRRDRHTLQSLFVATPPRVSRASALAMSLPRTFGGVDADAAVDPAFWAWATSSGVEAIGCAPADVSEGWRGVVATADVAPGDVVLRVPGALLMSARSAAADPDLVAAFESHGAALTPADRLCVHLLREAARGDASPWRAYVAQLPRRYDALAGWTSAQRDELQAPHAIRAASDAARDARDAHARAARTLEALALPEAFRTSRAWLWARGATASRTVHVPFDPAGALCPVGDLFNHAPPPAEDEGAPDVLGSPLDPSSDQRGGFERDSSFERGSNAASNGGPRFAGDGAWDEASDAYVFRARAPYRAGEQISLCYGRHANLALLEHYGFLLPMYAPNPNDEAPIGAFFEDHPGGAGDDDRGAASLVTRRAAEALRDLSKAETTREGEEEGRDVPRTLAFLPNGRLPWTALRDARLAALGPNPPRDARASVAVGGAAGADFERRAFRLARDAAAAALLAMPTTAREDLAAIQRSLMRRSSFRRGRGGGEEPDDKREENDEAREGGGGCGGRTGGGASSDAGEDDAEAAMRRDGSRNHRRGLDASGAPTEWTRGGEGSEAEGAASRADLAVRWRLAYKRAIQEGYRLAEARVAEASGRVTEGEGGRGRK